METRKDARQKQEKSWIVFLLLVIFASLVVEAWIAFGGSDILYLVLMWIPAFAAIIANIVSLKESKEKFSLKRFLSRLGFRICKIRYILLGIILPLVYLLVPYLIYWKSHPDHFAYSGVPLNLVLADIAPTMVLGVFLGLISATGEEIGWRGYMFPALLEKHGLKKALLITSVFWACWHLPLLIGGAYLESGVPLWYQLLAFVLCIVPVGIIVGILTYKSNSVWPAAFLHAAHNNYDQAVFGLLTRGTDKMFYVSETGVFTILCAWIIAAVMLVFVSRKAKSGL